jgi:hypothetical protein
MIKSHTPDLEFNGPDGKSERVSSVLITAVRCQIHGSVPDPPPPARNDGGAGQAAAVAMAGSSEELHPVDTIQLKRIYTLLRLWRADLGHTYP